MYEVASREIMFKLVLTLYECPETKAVKMGLIPDYPTAVKYRSPTPAVFDMADNYSYRDFPTRYGRIEQTNRRLCRVQFCL